MNQEENKKAEEKAKQAETDEQQQEETQAKAESQEATPEESGEQTKADAEEQPSEADTLKKQVAELNDKYMRTCAEYDNYRKRTVREKADLIKSAGADILLGLLPVVDDMERALSHINEASDVEALKEGVNLIYKKFNDYLAKRGVKEIETKGLPLDTNVHEAITMIPAPTPDMKGKILDCTEKGYMLGDKVLRFAKVVVCQ
ncbi:MAG: nucleotide exchange factor GrpE [Marinilabiliaceae bacterium]